MGMSPRRLSQEGRSVVLLVSALLAAGCGSTRDDSASAETGGSRNGAAGGSEHAASGSAGTPHDSVGGSTGAGGTNSSGAGTLGVAGGSVGGQGGNVDIGTGGSSGSAGTESRGGASGGGGIGGAGQAGNGNAGSHASGSGGANGGSGGESSAYQPCPTGGAACAVLPLGDSITEGFGSSGAGYRVELFSQAVQHGKHLTFVGSLQNGPATVQNQAFPQHHEGHDGYTIDSGTGHSGISGSITEQALANYHPNIVLLMIGTNDINGNIDVNTAPERLGNLIDDITTRAPSTLVVVATIIPIANTGTNEKVKAYNAAIPALVSSRAAQGKHVVLLDNYAAFSKDSSYQTTLMYNYLHPNDAGYAVLGRAFFGALQNWLL